MFKYTLFLLTSVSATLLDNESKANVVEISRRHYEEINHKNITNINETGNYNDKELNFLPGYFGIASENAGSKSCGYQSCPAVQKGMLNIHVVPHTHLDVGWLFTPDEYYHGNHSWSAPVKTIIKSVIEALAKDESRRFVFVETYYLWKWWQDSTDKEKDTMKKLVDSGQLEITGGGWSINDGAVTHYQPVIDQFTFGFRKLYEMLGDCAIPRVGWQIDSFGHSRETASIMSALGYNGVFLNRIDYQDKTNRWSSKSMEMIWHGSPNNRGEAGDIFTNVLYSGHNDSPIKCLDPEVVCTNINTMGDQFLSHITDVAKHYLTKNIIFPVGGNFYYSNALEAYKKMDKLISLVKSKETNSKVNIMYSTPSCYLKAVNDENATFPTKYDDFLPYASEDHQYWTGFYSSRPTLKYFERRANNFLQICKQLSSLANLYNIKYQKYVDSLSNGLGIMQHHNAITGTQNQHVAEDYAATLSKGIKDCSVVTNQALRKLINPEGVPLPYQTPINMYVCPLLNISACFISETSETFALTLYNPLSVPVSEFVRVPVNEKNLYYTIRSPTGTYVPSQIVPIPDSVLKIPGRTSSATYELLFEALTIPPLGFTSYYIKKGRTFDENESQISQNINLKLTTSLGNPDKLGFTINRNGDIIHITRNNTNMDITQNFFYYNTSSGAFVFLPQSLNPTLIRNFKADVKVFKGTLVHEVHKKFNDWVSQVIRIYKDSNHIEFDWLVGPIPTEDVVGKEVVTRYSFPQLYTGGVFYTDSNGREMIKRKLNYRPTWDVNLTDPIPGNYYPVPTKITVKDNKTQLSILTDRSQGGSYQMLRNQVELMIHRRLVNVDGKGVGEELDEQAFGKGLVVRGSHYLTIGSVGKQNVYERTLAKQKFLQPWMFFTPINNISFYEWGNICTKQYSGLRIALPKNVNLLTLEPWSNKTLLLRLEHIFEKDEDEKLSKPVTVDLAKIFFAFTIKSIQEMTLGANIKLNNLNRLKWNYKVKLNATVNYKPFCIVSSSVIHLNPMQICTFLVNVEYNPLTRLYFF